MRMNPIINCVATAYISYASGAIKRIQSLWEAYNNRLVFSIRTIILVSVNIVSRRLLYSVFAQHITDYDIICVAHIAENKLIRLVYCPQFILGFPLFSVHLKKTEEWIGWKAVIPTKWRSTWFQKSGQLLER